HVLGSAHEVLRVGAPAARCGNVAAGKDRQLFRDAEVHQAHDALGIDHQVGGLEVAMDDACLVDGLQALGGLEGQLVALRRSEEHTSELQSRVDLVCRLLLEKKKQPALQTKSM